MYNNSTAIFLRNSFKYINNLLNGIYIYKFSCVKHNWKTLGTNGMYGMSCWDILYAEMTGSLNCLLPAASVCFPDIPSHYYNHKIWPDV